jgi:Spy/CpxP family protein refolding chaperone
MWNLEIRKTVLAFVMSSMVFVPAANASFVKPDPQAMAKKQTEWMKKDLALSDAQTSKVEDINLKYAKKMESLREDKEKDLEGVLSKDQFTKYKAKKAEHMKAHKEEWEKAK